MKITSFKRLESYTLILFAVSFTYHGYKLGNYDF